MFHKVSTAVCAALLAAGSVSAVSAQTGRALLTDDGSAAVGNPIQMLRKEISDLDLPFTLKKEDAGAEEADADEVTTQTRSLLQSAREVARAERVAALNASRAARAATRLAACETRVANIERRNRTRARRGRDLLPVPDCTGVDRTRTQRAFRAGECVRRLRDCSDGRPCCRDNDVCVTETVGEETRSLCERATGDVGAYGK